MKIRYEYDVVVGNEVVYYASTRQEAREIKSYEKCDGNQAKIVQRKYILQEQREVR